MTGWYPVALAEGLERGTADGTRLFGRELVVWRDEAGQSHVWEDRCPHRGMRLSFGFVRGDRIACLYHGWQFDAAGRCGHIPSHPALKPPSTIRVAVEPSIERLGMVWVAPDATDLPPETATVPVRSLALRAPASRAIAGLRDAEPFFDGAALQVDRAGPLLSLRTGPHLLFAAVQPVSDSESTVHLTLAGAPSAYRGAGQARVSAWAEALRSVIEASP